MQVKKLSRAAKIRSMLALGKPPALIATELGVTLQAVYHARYEIKQMEKKKAKKEAQRARALAVLPLARAALQRKRAEQKESFTPDEIQVGGDHYKKNKIQVWDAIHDWRLGFFSGNVIKYVARHKEKGGVEDLKKARHYLDKYIKIIEARHGE